MVQAIIRIDDETNRILNIVKAKYGLKDKSEAIDVMARQYQEDILEPELRPEFVKKIKKLEKSGKFTRFKSISDLRKAVENA